MLSLIASSFLEDLFRRNKKIPIPRMSASVGPMIIAMMRPVVRTTRFVPLPAGLWLAGVLVAIASSAVDGWRVLVNVLSNVLVRVVVCASAVMIVV